MLEDAGYHKKDIPDLHRGYVRSVLSARRNRESGEVVPQYHKMPNERRLSYQQELEDVFLSRNFLPWQATREARQEVARQRKKANPVPEQGQAAWLSQQQATGKPARQSSPSFPGREG